MKKAELHLYYPLVDDYIFQGVLQQEVTALQSGNNGDGQKFLDRFQISFPDHSIQSDLKA